MRQLFTFIVITLLGVYVGTTVIEFNPLEQSWFSPFASAALVIGLYGAVVGIDLQAIRKRWVLATVIVTIGVPLQIIATGALVYLFYPIAISWLLAVAIDQIDPISVDTLLGDKDKMSDEAKGLLRVWASFDDPVTVLFGFLVIVPFVSGVNSGTSLQAFIFGFVLNVFAGLIVALLAFVLRRWGSRQYSIFGTLLLTISLVLAFIWEAYLFAAICGLVLRPLAGVSILKPFINFLSRTNKSDEQIRKELKNEQSDSDNQKDQESYIFNEINTILFYFITFIVGITLANIGVDLRFGLVVAVIEFFVIQPLSAMFLLRELSRDMGRIAFAQQNGLTTLLMGLAFESMGFSVLGILIPAIIFINTFNLIVNRIFTSVENTIDLKKGTVKS